MNNSENIPSLIRQSLKEVRKEQNDFFEDKLQIKARLGIISKIRYFLYSKPYLIHIVTLAILYLGLIIGIFVCQFTENLPDADKLGFRIIYILFFTLIYLLIPFLLEILKPKLKIKWFSLWENTIKNLFKKTKWNNYDKAIYNLKIEKISYLKNGKYLKKCWLLWGGIFIGCLPIPEFQKALLTLNPIQIFETNFFGGFALFTSPLLCSYYFLKFALPVADIDNAIDIIQLLKERPKDVPFGRYKGQIEISDDFNEEDEEINHLFDV